MPLTINNSLHGELCSKFNYVLECLENSKKKEAIDTIVEMLTIAAAHFKEEEILMDQVEYPLVLIHKMVHEDILLKLGGLLKVLDIPLEKISWLVNSLRMLLENHNEHFDYILEEYVIFAVDAG